MASSPFPTPPPLTADALRRLVQLIDVQLATHRQQCAICLPDVPCPDALALEESLTYWMARVQLNEQAGGQEDGR